MIFAAFVVAFFCVSVADAITTGAPTPTGAPTHTGAPTPSALTTNMAILNYALGLEHLEYAFYRDGVALVKPINVKNDAERKYLNKIYSSLVQIRDHELTHVVALNATIIALGGTPVKECTYDFGYKTATEFLAIARVLENVGISAYTGAAYKIVSTTLLTVAASIATIEARHASYLNTVNHLDPFPNAFDSPLDMKAVVGLAIGFIVSCPQNITIAPYPTVTATPLTPKPGDTIELGGAFANSTTNSTKAYCVFYSGSASLNSTLALNGTLGGSCVVPVAVPAGDTFVFVMTSQVYQLMNDTGVLGGPALIVVA